MLSFCSRRTLSMSTCAGGGGSGGPDECCCLLGKSPSKSTRPPSHPASASPPHITWKCPPTGGPYSAPQHSPPQGQRSRGPTHLEHLLALRRLGRFLDVLQRNLLQLTLARLRRPLCQLLLGSLVPAAGQGLEVEGWVQQIGGIMRRLAAAEEASKAQLPEGATPGSTILPAWALD